MSNIRKNEILVACMTVAVILLFRILYIDYFQSLIVRYGFSISNVFHSFTGNIIVLLLSVVLDTLGVWYLSKIRPYGKNSIARFLLDMALITGISAIGAFILDFNDLTTDGAAFLGHYFIFSILTIFLFNAFFVFVLDIVFYALRVRESVRDERMQKRQAMYQYHKLKEQLNPHFLFNSLNMLDYLVQSNEKDRASAYIKKLANIYRYLLQTNDAELVTIEEELNFVGHYVDLLKVRFTEGIILDIDVPQEYMNRYVVPCGLQILVENAIKHNIVSKSEPLHVKIYIADNKLIVYNNIQLKINVDESMNVGLNNIRGQYADVTGKSVEIEEDGKEFIVKLPII